MCGGLTPNGTSNGTRSKGSGTVMEERSESLQEPKVREDWSKVVFPGHGRTTAPMSSQQLWLSVQGQHMTRPVDTVLEPCVGMRPPILIEE